MRVGIFGGTFDPPHIGHLLAASDAAEALSLDRVLWVPAATQPLKAATTTGAEHRRRMVELTIGDDPRFAVEPQELERGGLSFTVETLATLHERSPGDQLWLLVGADAWADFDRWREPERILKLARVAVAVRPGHAPAPDDRAVHLTTRAADVSSTEVRARVRAGQSIHGFVTEPVERFIRDSKLYV